MSPTPPSPPYWAERLLETLLKAELAEEVLGDLEERFQEDAEKRGLRRARRHYWYQTLNYLRPFALQSFIHLPTYPLMLIRHTVLMAYRQFRRYQGTFLINLIGLASGLACALLIYLWVGDEMGVDAFHKQSPRLYQAMLNHEESGTLRTGDDTPMLLAKALEEEIPEIKQAVIDTDEDMFARAFSVVDGDRYLKRRGKFTGTGFFELFSYPLIYGDAGTVLSEPGQIVISNKLAHTIFGSAKAAMGQTLEWQLLHFQNSSVVVGVYEDLPDNSTQQFDFLLPMLVFEQIVGDGVQWGNFQAKTYVLLEEGVDVANLNARLDSYIMEKADYTKVHLFLTPYADRYLHGHYENGVQAGGRIDYVRLFALIALFIVLIACINFMNLSTAQANRRLKEVGVKKSLGAQRGSLVFQYLGESVLLTTVAFLGAFFLAYLLLPQFNEITGKSLTFTFEARDVLILMGITLFTGLVAGSYPAFYLSKFSPLAVFRGSLGSSIKEVWARKGLVVLQFALSVILIVSVGVVYQQIEFAQNKNLGYDQENLVYFPLEGRVNQDLEGFLTGLKQIPGIENATATGHTGTENAVGGYTTGLSWRGKNPEVEVKFEVANVYYDLIETMGIEITKGRSFDREFQQDQSGLILNQTAVAVMGLENPVGETVNLWGEDRKVIGVAKDFHMNSIHQVVEPMFFRIVDIRLPFVMVRISPGQDAAVLDRLESYYSEFNPGFSLDYRFVDQAYASLYVAEERVSLLSRYFAGLAILISCLGLLGLATYSAERRTKEIGVRKVLGASSSQLVWILSKEFTQVVLIGILIALPVSYLLMQEWLSGFAYRIELSGGVFILAGLLALLIAWMTVGLRTYYATRVNPAQCLRDE